VTAAMLHHVINPPGRPLAGVLRTRPEDDRRGAHVVGVRAIVDYVTRTCSASRQVSFIISVQNKQTHSDPTAAAARLIPKVSRG